MRLGLWIAAALALSTGSARAETYCEGYRAAYIQSYRETHNFVTPPTPACPTVAPPRKDGEPADEGARGRLHGSVAGGGRNPNAA